MTRLLPDKVFHQKSSFPLLADARHGRHQQWSQEIVLDFLKIRCQGVVMLQDVTCEFLHKLQDVKIVHKMCKISRCEEIEILAQVKWSALKCPVYRARNW